MMPDREKVIKALETCKTGHLHRKADKYVVSLDVRFVNTILELLKEQENLVDVDALREKLGFAKNCEQCKQNTRHCQYDSHFSLMDFCERFDMAIEELKQEGL